MRLVSPFRYCITRTSEALFVSRRTTDTCTTHMPSGSSSGEEAHYCLDVECFEHDEAYFRLIAACWKALKSQMLNTIACKHQLIIPTRQKTKNSVNWPRIVLNHLNGICPLSSQVLLTCSLAIGNVFIFPVTCSRPNPEAMSLGVVVELATSKKNSIVHVDWGDVGVRR